MATDETGRESGRDEGGLDSARSAPLIGESFEDECVESTKVRVRVGGAIDEMLSQPRTEPALGFIKGWSEVGTEGEVEAWLVNEGKRIE
ncbi:hypothetical protein MASR2M8_09740 [Opitutaceae bacterium]